MMDLIIFAVALGTLIIGHELGHFLAARALGVKVDEFGIGLPPRLLTLFEAGGTRFTLNAIPLGGFVRPSGEDDPSVVGGLAGANKRTRTGVLLAGPLSNLLLALVAFTMAFKFAAPDTERVLINGVNAGSPAEQVGLQRGDVVLRVDGVSIRGFEDLQTLIADRVGRPTTIELERGDVIVTVEMIPRASPPEGEGPIGVTLGNPTRRVGWAEAIDLGVRSTWFQFDLMLHLPASLLLGDIEPEEARVTGLKGMYDMFVWTGENDRATQRPFMTLNLVGVISAGLALANLLPIPALDGGRLLFVAFEALFRRRISPKYEGLAHTVGFMFLLALLIYVNIQDFVNPISLPR